MLRVMVGSMLSSCHKHKIAKSIISLLPIFMMYHFIVTKFSSNMFFHLKLMLSDVFFIANSFKSISTRAFSYSIVPSWVIFPKFSNCDVGASACAIQHLFIRENAGRIASETFFLIINCPYEIYLLLGMFLIAPFKFMARLVPDAISCMSPVFWYIGYSHV